MHEKASVTIEVCLLFIGLALTHVPIIGCCPDKKNFHSKYFIAKLTPTVVINARTNTSSVKVMCHVIVIHIET